MTNPPPPDLNLEISPNDNKPGATMGPPPPGEENQSGATMGIPLPPPPPPLPPPTAVDVSLDLGTPAPPNKTNKFIIPLAIISSLGIIGIVVYTVKRFKRN